LGIFTIEQEFQQEVEANFRWNFGVNLLDLVFITFGLSLISRETVISLLVSQLTDSRIAVGLVPAIHSLGFYLPQLLTANYTEGLRYKKPFVMFFGGLGERVPYLFVGLAVWLWADTAPRAALAAIFLGLAATAASAGIATPAWFDMIAKVIPMRRRGLFSGLSHGLGALWGVAGAGVVGWSLAGWPFPQNFAWLFGLAFVCVAISWVGLALNREPESPTVKTVSPMRHYLRQLPNVLRRDRNYMRFLISRAVSYLGSMAGVFFMVYGASNFGIGGRQVGTLTAVLVGSQAVMNLVWGLVGDRWGHKAVLAGGAFAMTLAALVAWLATSPAWLAMTFALLGAALAGDTASGFNIILEFCRPEDRPTYIGLTNTLLAPFIALGPVLGGWLATWVGYRGMFGVALGVAGVGGTLLALWVREPRHNHQAMSGR
jgi:MFS family permease